MKLLAIIWHSYYGTLKNVASKVLEGIIDVKVYSSRQLERDPKRIHSILHRGIICDFTPGRVGIRLSLNQSLQMQNVKCKRPTSCPK